MRARTRSRCLQLEPLEGRIAPATLIGTNKVTYQDVDGDNVTVRFSKPFLTPDNVNNVFKFSKGQVNDDNSARQQLYSIALDLLSPAYTAAAGTSITVTATPSTINGGDGFATVFSIYAANYNPVSDKHLGIDLGPVTIDGELGGIRAGDSTTATSGLKGLSVHSAGLFLNESSVQIMGKLDFLKVNSDVRGARIDVSGGADGRIGRVFIGGSLLGVASLSDGSGHIHSAGDMGLVTIKGNLIGAGKDNSGSVQSGGKLAGARIGGFVQGGGGVNSGRIASANDMGFVTIGENLTGGTQQSTGIVQSGGKLAGVKIGGSVQGGAGSFSGAIVASGDAGSIVVGGDVVGGSASGFTTLIGSGLIQARRITRLTLGGSLIAGTRSNLIGAFINNGAIAVDDDLGSVLIKGSVIGNESNPAYIVARGRAVTTTTTDVAIGNLRVLGSVEYAYILAGVNVFGGAENADAQIGNVFVGGDWIASSIAAGSTVGADGYYGNSDDAKMDGPDIKDVATTSSRIASLTIVGKALGTDSAGDHFGIVAENIGAVRIGGTRLALTAGNSNDELIVGIDFKVYEV